MIAVPTDDGGVTVHGSLQCPYYVHTALQARPRRSTTRRRASSRPRPAAGSAARRSTRRSSGSTPRSSRARPGRPVRMIYDRHEDIAATTKRHPAIVRHRTGVTRDGRLIAQDIEVVMDGGAYCTLTPVVLSRGAIHAGGPYRCPNVRIRPARRGRTRRRTAPSAGSGRRRTEFAAETHLNRIAEALGISPLEIRRRNVYHVGDTTPTGQVLRDSVAGEEVLERAAEAGEFERLRGRHAEDRVRRSGSGTIPGSPLRTGRERTATRHRAGARLARRRVHRLGRGQARVGGLARADRRRPDPDPDRLDRDGAGDQDDLPAARRRRARRPDTTTVELAPQDTAFVPDSGPTVASRTAMVVGGLLIKAARRLRAGVETATGGTFAATYRDYARANGPLRIDQRFEPYPGRRLRRRRRTAATPTRPSAGRPAWRTVDVDLDTGEVHVRDVVAADDIGRVIHPVLAEGQVEGGTLQAVGYATIEEIKLRDGRYLNDRLATYIIPTSLDAPRITTILVEAPFAGAPHGAKGVGELPMDVGAPAVVAAIADATGVWIARPAGQPGTDPGRARRRARRRPAAAGRLGAGERRRPGADERRTAFTVNATPVEVDVPGHAPAARRPARGPRPDRHQGGLRRGRVRRVHRPARRRCRSIRASSRSARSTARASRRSRAWRRRAGQSLDPLQAAFLEPGGAQCGICTPGMLMAARAYLDAGGGPDEDAIREAIAGNLCRCTGYTKIVDAIAAVGERGPAMSGESDRIAVPTNGRGPHPVAPLAGGPDDRPGRRSAPRRSARRPAARRCRRSGWRSVSGSSPRSSSSSSAWPARRPVARLTADAGRAARHQPARPRRGVRDPGRGAGPADRRRHGPDGRADRRAGRAARRASSTCGGSTRCAASRSTATRSVLGALTTYTEIRRSALCREHLPVLVEAAATIGAAQIQNRGTLGGNVANASPAGDTLPVLLAADASFVLGSARGERTVAGRRRSGRPTGRRRSRPTSCSSGSGSRSGPVASCASARSGRAAPSRSARSCMALGWRDGDAGRAAGRDVRLALGSVAATPIRARATEAVLEGRPPTPETADRAAETLAGRARARSTTSARPPSTGGWSRRGSSIG